MKAFLSLMLAIELGGMIGLIVTDVIIYKRAKATGCESFLSPSQLFFRQFSNRIFMPISVFIIFVMFVTAVIYPICLGTDVPNYMSKEDILMRYDSFSADYYLLPQSALASDDELMREAREVLDNEREATGHYPPIRFEDLYQNKTLRGLGLIVKKPYASFLPEENPYRLLWGLVGHLPEAITIPKLTLHEHINAFFRGSPGRCVPISKPEWKGPMPEENSDTYYLFFPQSPPVATIMLNHFSGVYMFAVILLMVAIVLLFVYQYMVKSILERKRARKQLEDIRNYTHDMKTPLAILWQYSDQVNSENFPPAERERLEDIKAGLRDMVRRVQGVLEFMRQGAGALRLSAFSLNDLAEDCLLEISPLLDDKGIRWSAEAKADMRVEADRSCMERAIGSFLSNAAKYTPQGGNVNVRVSRVSKKRVRVMVFNSGAGIPKAEQKKIWEMFYTLDGSGGNTPRDAGAGLALARDIASKHNGNSSCENVPGGVEFWIEIPIKQKRSGRITGRRA